MKIFLIFALIAFSLYTVSQSKSCSLPSADETKKNCLALNVNPTKQDTKRCCWLTGKVKGVEEAECESFDYQNLLPQIGLLQALGMTDIKVDCSANYLKVAALLVLAIMF